MSKIDFNNPPKMMPIKEAARYLGVSEYFLRQGVKDNTVPNIKSGTKYYIAVDTFLERINCRDCSQ